jgi:hypothetical protein
METSRLIDFRGVTGLTLKIVGILGFQCQPLFFCIFIDLPDFLVVWLANFQM